MTGGTYDHTCLTHSSTDAQFDALISNAITTWGFTDCGVGMDIVGLPEWPQDGAFADANPKADAGIVTGCSIRMSPYNIAHAFDGGNDEKYWHDTVTHEVGHCLGFGHVTYPSIMQAHGAQWGMTEWDMAAIRILYP